MSKKNLDNIILAKQARDERKEMLAAMSEKQRKINQFSPHARQILGHILRMPKGVQDEVKAGVADIF